MTTAFDTRESVADAISDLARITCLDPEDILAAIAEMPGIDQPIDPIDLAWLIMGAIENWSWAINTEAPTSDA